MIGVPPEALIVPEPRVAEELLGFKPYRDLTPTEVQVLLLLDGGLNCSQIATMMNRSKGRIYAVRYHLAVAIRRTKLLEEQRL